jgi:hypothetical protein
VVIAIVMGMGARTGRQFFEAVQRLELMGASGFHLLLVLYLQVAVVCDQTWPPSSPLWPKFSYRGCEALNPP